MKQTDEELVRKCLKKDPKAQKMFYDRFSPMLFGLCRRYARCKQDAEDIFQEAFIKAFEQIGKYSFKGSLEGWLRKLFVNHALNYYRYDKSSFFVDEQTFGKLTEQPLQIERLSSEDLLKMVEELPEQVRLVFNLIEIEGYSYAELSEMWQVSQSSLRGMNYRAKQLLRLKIENKLQMK